MAEHFELACVAWAKSYSGFVDSRRVTRTIKVQSNSGGLRGQVFSGVCHGTDLFSTWK